MMLMIQSSTHQPLTTTETKRRETMEKTPEEIMKDSPAWREWNALLDKLESTDSPFYSFTPNNAYLYIAKHWMAWDWAVKPKVYVVGISGGIDSTCVAALACKIFGKDRVVGVSLPCDGQKDIADVDKAFEFLGIKRVTIDIGDAFGSLLNSIENNCIDLTDVCKTNMPARLRMTALYGVAQCLGGVVVNTCNRSESILGNDTLFGDDCGSYGPIQALTKTEVKAVAAWLGVPQDLVDKTPVDGLQPLSDEERLGITYAQVDSFLRGTAKIPVAVEADILRKFDKNRFKMEIVRVPGPKFEHYPDRIRSEFSA